MLSPLVEHSPSWSVTVNAVPAYVPRTIASRDVRIETSVMPHWPALIST